VSFVNVIVENVPPRPDGCDPVAKIIFPVVTFTIPRSFAGSKFPDIGEKLTRFKLGVNV